MQKPLPHQLGQLDSVCAEGKGPALLGHGEGLGLALPTAVERVLEGQEGKPPPHAVCRWSGTSGLLLLPDPRASINHRVSL